MCDEKAKEVRKSAASKATRRNTSHCGEQVIVKGGQIACLPVKELIREVGAEEEESDFMTSKFKDKSKLLN